MPPQREFKPRKRRSAYRDASLIVIAAEGERTERRYFTDLASPMYYRNPRVHVAVVDRDTHASSPKHVIAALNNFKREYALRTYDELWMVIDRDRWSQQELSDIATQCVQKGYELAVSNPCFELWLLLHVKDINEYSQQELEELEQNERIDSGRTKLEKELSDICGGYNKLRLDTSKYLPHVDTAIERARGLDSDPAHRWPHSLGTRVYLLAERVIS